jgi:hypothetical protein
MQIERQFIKELTLDQFADVYDLVLEVIERPSDHVYNGYRFHARFKGVEVMDRGLLISEYGSGPTEQEAIDNYRKKLTEKLIVYGAYTPVRQEILVPRLILTASVPA